jgi:hypothetical protein
MDTLHNYAAAVLEAVTYKYCVVDASLAIAIFVEVT